MEEIDTRQLSELLFVLKSADVARFKHGTLEIEFRGQPAEEEGEETVSGFHPPVTMPEPPKADDESGYRKLFRGNLPRFPRAEDSE